MPLATGTQNSSGPESDMNRRAYDHTGPITCSASSTTEVVAAGSELDVRAYSTVSYTLKNTSTTDGNFIVYASNDPDFVDERDVFGSGLVASVAAGQTDSFGGNMALASRKGPSPAVYMFYRVKVSSQSTNQTTLVINGIAKNT